ncbi:MAG: hypothetical protein A2252_09855 [Elusimicrobia bacterium RIFOXYA2_FULL_39_19]|nr:MAG: hypothetical protein A2252_09855 [Elusimicrobia bacterium RIFOXYA2_FULL_39_19]
MNIKELKTKYKKNKNVITARLNDFKLKGKNCSEENIFPELCFCLFTPQSKAVSCWESVEKLKKENLLFKGSAPELSRHLNKVRFRNNKAKYVVEARRRIAQLCKIINFKFSVLQKQTGSRPLLQDGQISNLELRSWLVKNIKGIGLKEAGHFLRNIGRGENLAILDRHILKNLKALKVIKEIPQSLTPKKYFEIEKKLIGFSKKVNIPVTHLDLLFWSNETGEIFK